MKKSKYIGVFKIGQRFGSNVIVSEEIFSRKGYANVLCKCDCGNERLVDAYTLYSRKVEHCSNCINYRKFKEENYTWKGFEEIPGKYFGRLKRNAKLRGLKFDLNLKDLWQLYLKQSRKCALSGVSIMFDNKTASLDRINSNGDYILSNVQFVHKDINLMKNHFDEEYFIEMCKKVVNNR